MRSLSFLGSFFAVFFLVACGGDGNPSSDKKINNQAFQLLDGDLNFTQKSASGTGQYIYSNENTTGTNSYTFTTNLPNNGSSLQLIANSNNKLKKGATLTLTRTAQGLDVQVQLEGGAAKDISANFENIDPANGPFSLVVDVHEEDGGNHILVWVKAEENHYEENEALYNSEIGEDLDGKGIGKFCGFKLVDAEVSEPSVGKHKHHHDH